jgi:hypothetical protein
MDGKRFQRVESDRPIAKPSFPLPMIFNPNKRSELDTRPQRSTRFPSNQHAHFYRKRTTSSGTPVYDFYITEGPEMDLREDH